MKKTIERITSTAILSVAFMLCTTSVWAAAPVPVVVWDGDFSSLSKTVGDVTYSINNIGDGTDNTAANIRASDNSYLQVVNHDNRYAAPTITATGGDSAFGNATDGATVLIFASGMPLTEPSNRALLLLMDDTSTYGKPANGHSRFGIARANGSSNGKAYGGDAAGGFVKDGKIITDEAYVKTAAYTDGAQSIALTYKGSSGMKYYVNGLQKGEYNPIEDFTPTGVCIGGVDYTNSSWFYAQKSMKIHAIAIFDHELTQEEIAAFVWPSSKYAKWAYAKNVYTWVSSKESSDIGSSSNGTLYLFDVTSGANTSTTLGSGGDSWKQFCIGQTQYSAPGCALRFTSSSANKTFTGGFAPFAFGGIIVESDAEGLSIGTTNDGRTTVFGAASGVTETWFGFDANASVIRSGKFCFSGNVNLDIAKQKTLTLTAAGSPAIVASVTSAQMATTAGGALKMHGLGKLAVSTLTATGGATLDFSDVQEDADVVRSTTPFIQGNLTIDSTTKFVFPAGLAKETAYTLCSGTLNGPSEMIADITVGTTLKKNVPLTFSGNTVSYGDPVYAATVDGTTVTWDGDQPESYDGIVVTFSGTGTVEGLSGSGTTINAADGVTVDVTSFTSPKLLGAGTFRWTANYPTTVPTGDFSYEYVGTGVSTEIANVTANGYLKTSGNIALASFTLSSGATLEVGSGVTMVEAKQRNALSGNITIDSGATFSNLPTADGYNFDAVNYNQKGMVITVHGTLAMSNTRWSLKQKSYHEFKLYDRAMITGTGDGYGALDWIDNCGGQLDIYSGTVTIGANMRVRNGATTANWVASGATCKFTGSTLGAGGFSKSGAGTLSFEGTHTQTGGVSASDGTIALNNISMTSSTITLSSAQNSPTLKMIATDAATTVSAAVNVSANNRGQLAFEGAGTFALSGPNTNGSIVWLGTNPVPGALQLNGNVTINNGAVNNNYRFNKLGSGSSTLSLAAWSTCYDKDGNPGLGYTFDTIDADAFTGTIALSNSATDSHGGCTMNFSAVNIIKSSAVYGTPLVKVTKAVGARTDSYRNAINVSATQFNGNAAAFVYDDSVVGSEGIYLAEASYNGVNYKTLAAAVSDAKAAGADPSAITVYNASATIPSGYALVTAAGGAMTLRATGGDVYWDTSVASKDWYGAATASCTYYTSPAGTATTTFVDGDTLVFASDAQIFMKAGAYGTPIKVANNATLSLTRAGDGGDYILSGSTVTVESGSTLKMERYASNGWNSYELTYPNAHGIYNTTISGAGTFELGADHVDPNKAHGAAAAVLSGTSTIADTVTVKFADGATLTVPSVSAFSGSGMVTLDVSDLTLSSSGTTLMTFTGTTPSAADIASRLTATSGTLIVEEASLKVYPNVVVRDSSGNDIATYDSLSAALDAATSGATVTLLKDVSLTDRLFVNAGAEPVYGGTNNRYAKTSANNAITLDLNGHNITTASNIALAGGSLTITGSGTITTTNGGAAPVEIYGKGELSNKRTLVIDKDVRLVGGTYGLNIFGSNDAQVNKIDVEVTGTITGTLFVLGNLTNPANDINIVVNGTIAATASTDDDVNVGVALNGNANVTVNEGAEISGDSGIEVRAGSLTVNGGTITATAETYSYKPNGSGSTTKGAAIAIAQHTTMVDLTATLSGGTLDGPEQVGITNVNGSMTGVTVQATSSYTKSAEIPAGYKWVETETEGVYTLEKNAGTTFTVY